MLSLALSFLCVHVIDEGKSAFYWYNGALHYTFMHSCMLFFFALLLLYMKEEKRSKRVFFLLCYCFLAFVIGGANYITGLLSPVILLALLLLCIPAHEKRGLGGILPLLIMLIGFSSMSEPPEMLSESPPSWILWGLWRLFTIPLYMR